MNEKQVIFSKSIILNDKFDRLSSSAKLLFFYMLLYADKNGIVNGIKSIAKGAGCFYSDISELENAGYIKPNNDEFMTYIIVCWEENNKNNDKELRLTYSYRKWRQAVLERDCYKCQICGKTDNLVVHHIKPFAKYKEIRTDIDNGITLCSDCHRKYHKGERNG